MVKRSIKCPKKTITSQKWKQRNDSTSISTLFKDKDAINDSATDTEDNEPRRLIFSAPHGSTLVKKYEIVKAFCPECYCKSFPVPPLLGRPKTCSHSHSCQLNDEKARPRSVQSVFLKHNPRERERIGKSEKYTKRRDFYEDKTKDYFTTLKKRLADLEDELKLEQEEIARKQDEYKCLQEKYAREDNDEIIKPRENVENRCGCHCERRKVEDLMSFRKSQYFACHFSGTGSGTSLSNAEHKCIHKCELNNKMKLVPENRDEFGTSRCALCQKGISAEMLTCPPTVNSRSTLFDKSVFENCIGFSNPSSGSGPGPESVEEMKSIANDKMILTTHNNEKLEVTLPHNFLKEAQKPLSLVTTTRTYKNFKMPVPADSMALRYQKGLFSNALVSKKSSKCKP